MLDPFDLIQTHLDAGQERSDGAFAIVPRSVDRHHRRGLGDAIAFEDLDAAALGQSCRVASFTLSAPSTISRIVLNSSPLAFRAQPAAKVSIPIMIVAPTALASFGISS